MLIFCERTFLLAKVLSGMNAIITTASVFVRDSGHYGLSFSILLRKTLNRVLSANVSAVSPRQFLDHCEFQKNKDNSCNQHSLHRGSYLLSPVCLDVWEVGHSFSWLGDCDLRISLSLTSGVFLETLGHFGPEVGRLWISLSLAVSQDFPVCILDPPFFKNGWFCSVQRLQ